MTSQFQSFHLLTPEDFQLIFDTLSDPDRQLQIRKIFTGWGYPEFILDDLYREDFRSSSPEMMTVILQHHIYQWCVGTFGPTLFDPFAKMMIDNQVSLAMRCYLILNPMLIRVFEKYKNQPLTGDYYDCVENFVSNNYTLQDPPRVTNIYTISNMVRHNHVHILRLRAKKFSFNVEAQIDSGLTYKSQEVVDFLLDNYSYAKDEVLERAALRGNLRIFQRILNEGARIGDNVDLAKFSGLGGNLTIVKAVLAEFPERKLEILWAAVERNHRHVMDYIPTLEPSLISKIDQRQMNHHNYDLFLNQDTCSHLLDSHRGVCEWSAYCGPQFSNTSCFHSIISGYGIYLKIGSIVSGINACINTFDYKGFDILIELLKNKDVIIDSAAIGFAVRANSRYFFDRLFTDIQHTQYSVDNALSICISSSVQHYFFKTLIKKNFGDQIIADVLRQCVIHDDLVKFNLTLPRINKLSYLYPAVWACYKHGRSKMYRLLTVGWKASDFGDFYTQSARHRLMPMRPCRYILRSLLSQSNMDLNDIVYIDAVTTLMMGPLSGQEKYNKLVEIMPGPERLGEFLMVLLFDTAGPKLSYQEILGHPKVDWRVVVIAIKYMYETCYPHAQDGSIAARRLNEILSQDEITCVHQAREHIHLEYIYGDNGGTITGIASLTFDL